MALIIHFALDNSKGILYECKFNNNNKDSIGYRKDISIRVAPNTELAGYPANFLAGYSAVYLNT